MEETYWVPAKAKKRKEMVPTNSPMTATVCPRVVGGSVRRSRRTFPFAGALAGASVFMVEEAAYGGYGRGYSYKDERRRNRGGTRWKDRIMASYREGSRRLSSLFSPYL